MLLSLFLVTQASILSFSVRGQADHGSNGLEVVINEKE